MSHRGPWMGALTIVTPQNVQESSRYTLTPRLSEHPCLYQVACVQIGKKFDVVGMIYVSPKLQGPKPNGIILSIRMKAHARTVLMGDLNARTNLLVHDN